MMEILPVVLSAVPAAATAIFGVMAHRLKRSLEARDQRLLEEEAEQKEQQKRRDVEHAAICQGLQIILRNEIVNRYNRWQDLGGKPLSILERDVLLQTYQAYHALGGNGTVTEIYREMVGNHYGQH